MLLLLLLIIAADACSIVFDVVVMQDVGSWMDVTVQSTKRSVVAWDEDLKYTYPGSRLGVVTFGDKPIPHSGCGDFAGNGLIGVDRCYAVEKSFNEAAGDLDIEVTCGKSDLLQNGFDAFLNVVTDNSVGWTDDGHVRVVVMVTSSPSHFAFHAQFRVDEWNAAWGYEDQMDLNLFFGGVCAPGSEAWIDLISIAPKYRADPNFLTTEEKEKFDLVLKSCGPFPMQSVTPNEGQHFECSTSEYSTAEQMASALKVANVIPVVIAVDPTRYDLSLWLGSWDTCNPTETSSECVARWWQDVFTENGVLGKFVGVSPYYLHQQLFRVLEEIRRDRCLVEPTDGPTEGPCNCVGDSCLCDGEIIIRVKSLLDFVKSFK